MTLPLRCLISLGLVGSTLVATQVVHAQPAVRDHRVPKRPTAKPPVPAPPPTVRDHRGGPTEAPPPPKAERYGKKDGYVWIAGRWQWKDGKWAWVNGHWDRARAKKKWQDGRWEKRGAVYVYVDGRWVDDAAAPAPAPAPAYTGPRSAPPPPRAERYGKKDGFIWIAGRWQWKDGKWDWVNGHWDRPRAKKKWREGRWEQRGAEWAYVDGAWVDDDGPAAAAYTGPRAAPPPPRAETYGKKDGFVWIPGHWQWKDRKWDWVNGHWDRPRAKKKWREGRWEQRGEEWAFVDGEWIDDDGAAVSPPPPPPRRPPVVRDHRPRRLERPVVGSYWPVKGKIGTRVVIRGKNFGADTTVIWAGQPLRGAKIEPERIVFQIPSGATTGTIAVRAGRRTLSVGPFEVAASFDAAAELAKQEAERRRAAEAAVRARNARLAADRAARRAEIEARIAERRANREQRRAERVAAIRARWDRAFLASDEAQDELTLHAQRVAQLERLREVAELAGNTKISVRVEVAASREDTRHDQRMAALKAAFQGGRP